MGERVVCNNFPLLPSIFRPRFYCFLFTAPFASATLSRSASVPISTLSLDCRPWSTKEATIFSGHSKVQATSQENVDRPTLLAFVQPSAITAFGVLFQTSASSCLHQPFGFKAFSCSISFHTFPSNLPLPFLISLYATQLPSSNFPPLSPRSPHRCLHHPLFFSLPVVRNHCVGIITHFSFWYHLAGFSLYIYFIS